MTAYVAAIGLASVAALFSIKGMVQSSIEPSFPFPRKKGHDEVGHRTDKECACDRGAQKKRQVRMIGAS